MHVFYMSIQRSISNKNNENRASKVIDRFGRAGILKTYKHTMTVHTMHGDHHSNETLVASGATTTTTTGQAYYTMCRRSGSRRTIKSPICEPPSIRPAACDERVVVLQRNMSPRCHTQS